MQCMCPTSIIIMQCMCPTSIIILCKCLTSIIIMQCMCPTSIITPPLILCKATYSTQPTSTHTPACPTRYSANKHTHRHTLSHPLSYFLPRLPSKMRELLYFLVATMSLSSLLKRDLASATWPIHALSKAGQLCVCLCVYVRVCVWVCLCVLRTYCVRFVCCVCDVCVRTYSLCIYKPACIQVWACTRYLLNSACQDALIR